MDLLAGVGTDGGTMHTDYADMLVATSQERLELTNRLVEEALR